MEDFIYLFDHSKSIYMNSTLPHCFLFSSFWILSESSAHNCYTLITRQFSWWKCLWLTVDFGGPSYWSSSELSCWPLSRINCASLWEIIVVRWEFTFLWENLPKLSSHKIWMHGRIKSKHCEFFMEKVQFSNIVWPSTCFRVCQSISRDLFRFSNVKPNADFLGLNKLKYIFFVYFHYFI